MARLQRNVEISVLEMYVIEKYDLFGYFFWNADCA
jgi:hypothetical protein